MPETAKGGSSSLDTPRSPLSISTDSSRRESLKPVHTEKEKGFEPPTPISPHVHLTRKRAASLNTDTASLPPRIGDLALYSANGSGPPSSDITRGQVCLCQPDPKIPRPRNAFILYRQHYQAQVVAQHPGLANPEISKIIGEQWREQAPEVKNEWKRLAEEEKQRHQRQYPGYRYQPRRAGRGNGSRPLSSPSDEPIRCPKCNGRYISTPSTPLTPFTPVFGTILRNDRLLPPFTPSATTATSRSAPLEQTRLPPMQNTMMESPRTAPPHQQTHRRGPHQRPQPLHTHREHDEIDLLTPSPDPKRRRFANELPPQRGYPASPVSYASPRLYQGMPMSTTTYRPQQLPGPGMLVRQGPMGPPPAQSPMLQQSRYQYPTRSATYDESLRLPPLQTQMTSSAPIAAAQRTDIRIDHHVRDSQAMGVEAMIMSIPFLSKIKVLQKIAPPLRPPGLGSPAPQIRGAVVAIEGTDKTFVAEIGEFIHEYLNKDASCAVKTWTAEPRSASRAADTEMADAGTASLKPAAEGNAQEPFVDYLAAISRWHMKSLEITKYITTIPSQPSLDPELPQPPESTNSACSGSISVLEPSSKILPVALLSAGYSLSTSDDFARRIPITDEYAPVDHWQWMATLWRGIIGADVTVFARQVSSEELEKFGGVEIHNEIGSIILRVGEGGRIDEKTARRLGFEVLEMARGVENKPREY